MCGEGPGSVERVSEEEAVNEDLVKNKNSFMRMMIIMVASFQWDELTWMLIKESS